MEFKVKKDFLYVFLIDIVLAFLTCIFIPFVTESTWFFVIIMVIAAALLVLFNVSVIFSCCKIEDNTLTYRTGIFKYIINTKDIVKVERSKNIYCSLSLSIDRIRILTNENGKNKVYYISVVNNDELLKAIEPKKATAKKVEEQPTADNKEDTKPATKKTTKTATKKSPAKKASK